VLAPPVFGRTSFGEHPVHRSGEAGAVNRLLNVSDLVPVECHHQWTGPAAAYEQVTAAPGMVFRLRAITTTPTMIAAYLRLTSLIGPFPG
jgi:hypothetical protein